MQNGDAAALEMERGIKELGLKGFQVLGTVDGHELSDQYMILFGKWLKSMIR